MRYPPPLSVAKHDSLSGFVCGSSNSRSRFLRVAYTRPVNIAAIGFVRSFTDQFDVAGVRRQEPRSRLGIARGPLGLLCVAGVLQPVLGVTKRPRVRLTPLLQSGPCILYRPCTLRSCKPASKPLSPPSAFIAPFRASVARYHSVVAPPNSTHTPNGRQRPPRLKRVSPHFPA